MLFNAQTISRFLVLGVFLTAFSVISMSFAQTDSKVKALKDAENRENSGQMLDPKDYKKWKKEFVPYDVEDLAFSKDQRGCSTKMAFTNMLIEKYQEGTQPEELTDSRVLQPYVKKKYDQIRTKGVDQITYDTMTEYQSCMRTAVRDEDPSKAYDMEMRFGACGQLNAIVMDTLKSIKNRKSMDGVLSKYKNKAPDLSETTFGSTEDPVPYLVGKLYQEAGKGDYFSAVKLGSKLTYACYM